MEIEILNHLFKKMKKFMVHKIGVDIAKCIVSPLGENKLLTIYTNGNVGRLHKMNEVNFTKEDKKIILDYFCDLCEKDRLYDLKDRLIAVNFLNYKNVYASDIITKNGKNIENILHTYITNIPFHISHLFFLAIQIQSKTEQEKIMIMQQYSECKIQELVWSVIKQDDVEHIIRKPSAIRIIYDSDERINNDPRNAYM